VTVLRVSFPGVSVGYNTGMNKRQVDAPPFIKHFLDERVQNGEITTEQAEKTLEHYAVQVYRSPRDLGISITRPQLTAAHFEWLAFATRLKGRQGTVLPDFDAFYHQREELERKAFRPDQ